MFARAIATPTWPSWVPKFHASTDAADGSCLNVLAFEESDWALSVRTLSNPYVFSIKGLVVDRITYISKSFPRRNVQNSKELAKIVLECISQTERMNSGSNVDVVSTENIMFTFICGITITNTSAELDKDLSSSYEDFVTWCEINAKRTMQVNREEELSFPPFWHNLGRSSNRRFFITDGAHLGMAPAGARIGDFLCILSGSRLPFILRREGAFWRLIGDAYSRRFMKNAIVNERYNRSDLETRSQWFDIH